MSQLDLSKLEANAVAGNSAAQFLLSQVCRENGELPEMLKWLKNASEQGLADARDALGHCYEAGVGVKKDLDEALSLYDEAVAGGSPQAGYRIAELLYKSRNCEDHEDVIRSRLERAALAGYPPALRTVGYLAMQQQDNRLMAMHCFRQAAKAGDPISAFNLGWCLKQGWAGDDSSAHVAHWLSVAADRRYPYAGDLLAGLAAASPPARPLFEDQPVKLGRNIALFPGKNRPSGEQLSTDLPVVVYPDVLNIIDCAYLMFLAEPQLKRASVINPSSDISGMVSEVRTNSATYLYHGSLDIISRYIELKITQSVGEALEHSEPMSLLRYAPGEYYKPHVDFFNPKLNVSKGLLADGGQRTASAVTYLVAPTSGGGTSFPRINLTVPAKTGSTLWFRNCGEDGLPDERSLHSGDTVDEGQKWVVTKWFHERETSYASPRLKYPAHSDS